MVIDNGVPYEQCMTLCQEAKGHPWFTINAFSCDPGSDWFSSLAAYVQTITSQPAYSWMVPRYEIIPNECWNPFFLGTGYFNSKAAAHWPANAGLSDTQDQ